MSRQSEVEAFVDAHPGYLDGVDMPDGRVAFLIVRLFGADIAIGAAPTEFAGIDETYSYATPRVALRAWADWIGNHQCLNEPQSWIRHRPTNRRRPEGDASREHVAP